MPATPPLSFEHSGSAPQDDATTTAFQGPGTIFVLTYDKLVLAVGAYSQSFEQANQPFLDDGKRRKLVVGAGPTGVKLAAELHDLMNSDIKKAYQNVIGFAKISLYDVAPGILGMFDRGLTEYVRRLSQTTGDSLPSISYEPASDAGMDFALFLPTCQEESEEADLGLTNKDPEANTDSIFCCLQVCGG